MISEGTCYYLLIYSTLIHLSTLPRNGRIDDGIYTHISYNICFVLLFLCRYLIYFQRYILRSFCVKTINYYLASRNSGSAGINVICPCVQKWIQVACYLHTSLPLERVFNGTQSLDGFAVSPKEEH